MSAAIRPPPKDASVPPRDYSGGGGGSANRDNGQTISQPKGQGDPPYEKCNVTAGNLKPPTVVEVILYKGNLYTVPTELLKFLDEYFGVEPQDPSAQVGQD